MFASKKLKSWFLWTKFVLWPYKVNCKSPCNLVELIEIDAYLEMFFFKFENANLNGMKLWHILLQLFMNFEYFKKFNRKYF